MASTAVNGITLGWDRFEAAPGAPTVLLVSGLGAQRIRWSDAFCAALVAHGLNVVRFDNRDAGESTHFTHLGAPDFAALAQAAATGRKPEVPYTLHDMATDAMGLVDAMGVRQVHVVGRSMGGMIAQVMAFSHPERVRSLTSIMSSTGNPALPSASPEVMGLLMRPSPRPEADREAYVAHRLAFARRIAGKGFAFDEAGQRELILRELQRASDPTAFARQVAAIAATGDLRGRIAGIRVPTLVVHGTDDELILPACGEDTAAHIPGAQLELIEGMGHDVPRELNERMAGAIARTVLAGETVR